MTVQKLITGMATDPWFAFFAPIGLVIAVVAVYLFLKYGD
jgi:hypothetical protein